MVNVQITDRLNNKYSRFVEGEIFTVLPNHFIQRSDKICCIGSCFAEEIRLALANDFEVVPDFRSLSIDTKKEKIDELPERPHISFYNPENIVNELAIAAGEFEYHDDDIFQVDRKNYKHLNERFYHQDPYRRQLYGRDKDDLLNARKKLEKCLAAGFQAADVYIFTFGLNEIFRRKSNGNALSQYPSYGDNQDRDDCYVHWLSYDEVCNHLREIIRLCEKLNSQRAAKIIFTVSPVPMLRTFSEKFDVFTINAHSKANLLAAVHQVVAEYDNVNYFESYELCQILGKAAFKPDGRHVQRSVVASIVEMFKKKFLCA